MPTNKHDGETSWEDVKKTTQSFAQNILNSTRQSLEETYETSRDRLSDTVEDLGEDARRFVESTETYIKQKPLTFIAGALVAGLVVGMLLRRR